ncbi:MULTISPECIES: hypothetical protein [Sandaracinus]|uniref:hypothetical protein n=1 Tax=Sandaracinus TaxID=1055688 RepID=UPI0019D491C5|nr:MULTISPECIES: hypothetical protein [Sandaracinus]
MRDDDGAQPQSGTLTLEVGAIRIVVGREFDRATLRVVLEVLRELDSGAAR